MTLRIDNKTARAIFLGRHGLADNPSGPGKGSDLLSVIQKLGFVQLDSINTVARAHHMILHARRPAYRSRALHLLHDRDRAVFEHWTHDASMIDMAHFPHWRLRFRRHADTLASRWNARGRDGFTDKIDTVLHRIRDQGPCSSGDVGADEARSSGGWWDWHPSKTALEYLWFTGEIAVTRRDGFRKVYDLTENVIPPEYLNARLKEAETVDWACRSALTRLGFATPGEVAAFWKLITPAEAKTWCQAAQARGEIIPVDVAGADGKFRRAVAWPDVAETVPEVTGRLRILSPFDPALRDRARAERLFGFSYRIEIFVPEAKRVYGYYVFPILEGDRLIGRVDMKAERDTDRLHIRALWPETGVRWGKGRLARFDAAVGRTARLADVSDVSFEPGWLRA